MKDKYLYKKQYIGKLDRLIYSVDNHLLKINDPSLEAKGIMLRGMASLLKDKIALSKESKGTYVQYSIELKQLYKLFLLEFTIPLKEMIDSRNNLLRKEIVEKFEIAQSKTSNLFLMLTNFTSAQND